MLGTSGSRVCALLTSLLGALTVLKVIPVEVTIVLSVDHLGLHLVVNTDVAAHGLLVILELHLHLLRCQVSCTLALGVVVDAAVLAASHLVLHVECLLLLEVEVLHSLVVLAVLALV